MHFTRFAPLLLLALTWLQATNAYDQQQQEHQNKTEDGFPSLQSTVYKATKRDVSSSFQWPEQTNHGVKSNVGIVLSGGGMRSLVADTGVMRQIHAKKKETALDYMATNSGASWFMNIYMFYQSGTNQAANDEELLGKPVKPEDMTMDNLNDLSEKRVDHAATRDPIAFLFELIGEISKDMLNPSFLWHELVKRWVFQPYLDAEVSFSLNEDTKQEILKTNPALSEKDIVTPVKDSRPYGIELTSIMASRLQVPTLSTLSSEPLPCEWTPLYSGYPLWQRFLHYVNVRPWNFSMNLEVGGVGETFAKMGSLKDEVVFVNPDEPSTTVNLDTSKYGLGSIKIASGTSSNILGGLQSDLLFPILDLLTSFGMETNHENELAKLLEKKDSSILGGGSFNYLVELFKKIYNKLIELGMGAEQVMAVVLDVVRGPEYPFFPVTQGTSKTEIFALADGGLVSNTPMQSLIIRNVKKMFAVSTSCAPLGTSAEYNPEDGYVEGMIDAAFAANFGLKTDLKFDNQHIFEGKDFVPFVKGMQANMEAGKGAFYRMKVRTVKNELFGIPAGMEFDLAYYLPLSAAPTEFVDRLPEDTRQRVELGMKEGKGDFPNFPCFSLGFPAYTNAQVNLMSGMVSYAVELNWDMISDMFDDKSEQTTEGAGDLTSLIRSRLRGHAH